MLRFFLIRFILPLIAFLLVRWVLKNIWGSMNSSVAASHPCAAPPAGNGGELRKDPVCGTYVAENASVKKVVDGKPVHFCSAACRDKFRAA